jgi:molybdate transport system regulatory protein
MPHPITEPAPTPAARLKLKAQVMLGDEIAMGPGKADLLEAITRTGSISAAGRALGMSYRRTWLLVDTMNRCWREPLVATTMGGAHGGGATVTPFGARVLQSYRALEEIFRDDSNNGPAPALLAMLADQARTGGES